MCALQMLLTVGVMVAIFKCCFGADSLGDVNLHLLIHGRDL